ncbi:MAG: heavy-metal-associated domain-containing protein [Gemmatimonadetes bacterium]|nr:heavy-metal-associated domain-containing protein [Gemmatimonadota bacterium]
MSRIAGVDSVRVSLNEGLATVWLASENAVTIGQIREAIRSNGFTPKAATLRVVGRVVEDGGELALAFAASTPSLRLTDHASAPGLLEELRESLGATLSVEGAIQETRRGEATVPRIEVQKFARLRR